jgi:hypothetical protein
MKTQNVASTMPQLRLVDKVEDSDIPPFQRRKSEALVTQIINKV